MKKNRRIKIIKYFKNPFESAYKFDVHLISHLGWLLSRIRKTFSNLKGELYGKKTKSA
jgi:hypothetical protein